jgi:hypothetical protein
MFKLNSFLLSVISGCFFLLYSCTGKKVVDSDKDGKADAIDSCQYVYAKTPDGCPVKRIITGVNIYLETSASMGGYYLKNAEFKNIISDLAIKVDKNIKPVQIYFLADSPVRYKNSVEKFSTDIAITRPAVSRSSQLHKFLSSIAANTDSSHVSFLVSDCILSFPDAAIKANPEINRDAAPGALKNNIFSTFAELKKRGQAVSIFAFTSKFYGTYYDYRNVKTKLNGTPRPFYVWVIGHKDVLKDFEKQLTDVSSFQPLQALHFGLLDSTVNRFDLFYSAGKHGSWKKDGVDSILKDVEIPSKDSLRFAVAVDLRTLPGYVQQTSYFNSNVQLALKGCSAAVKIVKKEDFDRSKIAGDQQLGVIERASHVLLFSVGSQTLSSARITLSLPLQYDNWYQSWSVDDDRYLDPNRPQTFAFKYLIEGVKEAYETKNKNYLGFSIQLNK